MSVKKMGATCLLAGILVLTCLPAHAEVFINEIHYDDSTLQGDVGERIEIVATAGEDLSTYSVQLYNGNSPGAAVPYDSDPVPAGSSVTCGSTVQIATVNYATNSIQNGPNDGIALVNWNGYLVQFLSYEGAITGGSGPATGSTSTNLPASESGSTAAGTSLQLGGTGAGYANFSWNTSADDNFGQCNNNQTFNTNVLPFIVSSNPADGGAFEIAPPLQRSLTVTFNEPVSIGDGSPYSVVCSLSGALQAYSSNGRPGSPPDNVQSIDLVAQALGTPPLQIGDNCTLTVHAAPFTDSEGAHPAGDTHIQFSVIQQVNVPPYVMSSSPDSYYSYPVAANSNSFYMQFSEPVSAAPGAFTLQCSFSGSVNLSYANSAQTFMLTKTMILQNGETCVLTVFSSLITDSENLHPRENKVINFTIGEDPPQAPYVVSTSPAHNAIGVAPVTEFRIVFNEMVNVDSEAFVLQCAVSGMIANLIQYKRLEMVNGAGRAITLVSPAVLQPGEMCTLTILKQGVTDSYELAMSQDKVISFKVAVGDVSTYYNRVNTSSAEQLRCSLNSVIRGHTVYPYSADTTDTWDILEIADEYPNSPGHILDVYKNFMYVKGNDRVGGSSFFNYSREHTWPNSFGLGSDTGNLGLPNAPYTDTHMLYLADTSYSADHGNRSYSYCTQAAGCSERVTDINNGRGGGSGVYPGNSNWFNSNAFETWSKRQGDIARALMYMAIRYEGGSHTVTGQNEPDLELTDNAALIVSSSNSPAYMGLLTDLLLWHQADPPDAAELIRNEVIFNFQGNRNPFIDHPEWGTEALFTSAKPASCTLNSLSIKPPKRNHPLPTPKPPRQNIR